ncbi:MAG: hypothetical protein OEZ32_05995 [Nitrospinota bacterium]|nr:hypothetical protein [Nitrospinota bacterium]
MLKIKKLKDQAWGDNEKVASIGFVPGLSRTLAFPSRHGYMPPLLIERGKGEGRRAGGFSPFARGSGPKGSRGYAIFHNKPD